MPIQPAAQLTQIPPFPALSDRAAGVYNSKAYAFGVHMGGTDAATPGPFVAEINNLAQNVVHNAQEAESAAIASSDAAAAAAMAAGEATAQADAAMGYRNAAQAGATTAATKASEAEASAVAASKLNLGDKAAPPTTDNQGQPLRAGATYYDTTLGKWRVWTGAAWGDGISTVAGVSSLNGLTGALNLTTLDAYGITDAVRQTEDLASGSDLNNAVTSGFYRLSNGHLNASPFVDYGQLIVSRGANTVLQIVTGYIQGRLWYRTGVVDETPIWEQWRRLAEHSERPLGTSGGAMDCLLGNYFTATISANTTLSFVNIPAGAYSCVLEVRHTAGTITFPAGTVWSGAAPTLSPGRHLFFFQRAQLGTAGWYASALPGYSA